MSSPLNFDSSGKVKASTEEELAIADETSVILGYINGTLADGRPYYAYVAITPSKYREFYELTAARTPLTIEDYGFIIMFGYDYAPPPEVVEKMRNDYGFDENYGQKLKQDAEAQQKVFLDKQEASRLKDIVGKMLGDQGAVAPVVEKPEQDVNNKQEHVLDVKGMDQLKNDERLKDILAMMAKQPK